VGGTGIVYELLHNANGQRYAMKEMEIKNKAQMQMAVAEAEMLKEIMENISHPNIMHIEKVFQVSSERVQWVTEIIKLPHNWVVNTLHHILFL
jgi:serine/threonine protein kinase